MALYASEIESWYAIPGTYPDYSEPAPEPNPFGSSAWRPYEPGSFKYNPRANEQERGAGPALFNVDISGLVASGGEGGAGAPGSSATVTGGAGGAGGETLGGFIANLKATPVWILLAIAALLFFYAKRAN